MRKNMVDMRIAIREREEQNDLLKKEQEKLVQAEYAVRQLRNSWNNMDMQRRAVINNVAGIQNFSAATRLAQKMKDSFPQQESARIDANLARLHASIVTEYDFIDENLKKNARKMRDLHDELRFSQKVESGKRGVV